MKEKSEKLEKEKTQFKNSKNKKMFLILTIFLLLIIILTVVFIRLNKNMNGSIINEETNSSNSVENKLPNYKIEFTETSVISYKLTKDGLYTKINELSCNNCWILSTQSFYYADFDKGIVMLNSKDDNKDFLFNLEKDAFETYGGGAWLKGKDANPTPDGSDAAYILAYDNEIKKYGIIDKNGNIVKNFIFDKPDYFIPSGILKSAYSIENNMFVGSKDGKYGISKLTTDDIIIDYNFESIRLINDKYCKNKLNSKWYLYDLNTKDKVIDEGYDNLFVVNDEIVIVEENKYLYIKDYNGNNLVKDKIEDLSNKYYEYVCCGSNPGIEISLDDNIITIKTYKENNWDDYNQYEYNISAKSLTKIK